MLPIIETEAKRAIVAMTQREQEANARARKQESERRLLILQGQWKFLAMAYAGQLYKSDEARRAVQKRVKTTANVLGQLCNQVCVAYEREPLRQLVDASARASSAFSQSLKEARIAVRSKQWERMAFGLNVLVVVPTVTNSRLDYLTFLPHCFEIIANPADPMGDPAAIVVEFVDPSDRASKRLSYGVLDHEAWRYYDENGNPTRAPVFHNAGVFPGTVFRLSDPVDDWYDQFRGEGLVEATLEVAHLRARMDWVRFHQDRYREMFMAAKVDKLTYQIVSAETPLEVGMDPEEAKWQVEDLDLPIDNFRAHIRDHVEAAAESMGIPVSAVDVSSLIESVTPLGHLLSHKATEKIRADHVAHLELAERDLHWKSSLVMRGMGHPLASALLPDEVRKRFEIEYIPAPFVQDPEKQLRVDKARVDQGLASTYQIYMQHHPGTTLEEAKQRVTEIAMQEAELDKIYVEHNLSKDSQLRGASREKLLGTIGGQRSGQVRGDAGEDETP